MMKRGPTPAPKRDLVYHIQDPIPKELDEWEHSVVGQFAGNQHFSLEEVCDTVNWFSRSCAFIVMCTKDLFFQFKCIDLQDCDTLI